jgi:hypothetical protein
MFTKIEHWLSLGGQYTAAALVYFGITLLLAGSTFLDPTPTLAQTNSCYYFVLTEGIPAQVPGCPAGQQCCMYSCIPDSHICCENGTHGPADRCECLCCAGCNPNSLSGLPTAYCDPE